MEWQPHLRLVPDSGEEEEGVEKGSAPFAAATLSSEEFSRQRAERLIRTADTLGPIAVGAAVEVESPEAGRQTSNLMEQIREAKNGDEAARRGVKSNVSTDVIERSIKSGHVMEVVLQRDERGRVVQYGQAMDDVFLNALRFASGKPQMRRRSEAETRNGMRIEDADRQGLLEDHYLLVASRPADDMTVDEMRKCGFFVETMSSALQVITSRGGELVQESAFVSGIAAPGEERHDARTIEKMMAGLGVDVSGKSATEVLDTPVLIPKQMMPNGVIDIVKRYDEAAGGTFYGERRPVQDYTEHRKLCRQREAELEPLVESIVEDLLAASDEFETPTDATKILAKLSEKKLVTRAVADNSIDLRVFGAEAAGHIIEARQSLELGDEEAFHRSLSRAHQTARSSSCPDGGDSSKKEGSDSGEGADAGGQYGAGSIIGKSERKGWKIRQGVCRVKSCPTRPGMTKVGPCGVCMARCQTMFDKGKDPTKR